MIISMKVTVKLIFKKVQEHSKVVIFKQCKAIMRVGHQLMWMDNLIVTKWTQVTIMVLKDCSQVNPSKDSSQGWMLDLSRSLFRTGLQWIMMIQLRLLKVFQREHPKIFFRAKVREEKLVTVWYNKQELEGKIFPSLLVFNNSNRLP